MRLLLLIHQGLRIFRIPSVGTLPHTPQGTLVGISNGIKISQVSPRSRATEPPIPHVIHSMELNPPGVIKSHPHKSHVLRSPTLSIVVGPKISETWMLRTNPMRPIGNIHTPRADTVFKLFSPREQMVRVNCPIPSPLPEC